MEGLVPLVLRAIKKNRNRRQYECLDSSSLSYNITMAEIYHHHHHHAQSHVDHHHHHHRRHKSVEDFGNGVVASSSISSPPPIPKQQQLMRFRSQRMFSCITGS
ncbi:hypothetical protein HN51_020572 [Arachis hypogaea]|uniref:Uncharacterized protein LOC107463412 n=1 Tax=Arachis duranensis TaxID=130453 RepID=A0A6P4C3H3_ARADU|nr:uncharacterized protein LOC107463412 [Arachis duranensis]XP_025612078.1 POU domain, class 3, transcription factor 3-A [Arachis hypogaea]QHO32549.1 uncharacterized protein DS421_8g250770 [Arachis hypogaea]